MEVLEARGVECRLRDVLACLSPRFSDFICNWHVFLYRHGPGIFDTAYRAMDHSLSEPDETTPLYELLALGVDKLYEILQKDQYDAVICVHVFSGMMMTELRRKKNVQIPCFFVDTDYSCAPFTEQCGMDGYFIPYAALIPEFVSRGLPKEKLIPSGIPVRQQFYSQSDKIQARRKLGLPENGFVVLLMCGSMGCGPMRKLAKGLTDQIPASGMLVTICGRNEKLRKSLEDISDERLRLLGFCSQMSEYMDAADLIVTKPGGLSSTEAANKHLPMVFINAIGGCEEKNFELFLKEGFAIGSKDPDEVLKLVADLRDHPEKLSRMRSCLEQAFDKNAAQMIVDTVMRAAEADSRRRGTHL